MPYEGAYRQRIISFNANVRKKSLAMSNLCRCVIVDRRVKTPCGFIGHQALGCESSQRHTVDCVQKYQTTFYHNAHVAGRHPYKMEQVGSALF